MKIFNTLLKPAILAVLLISFTGCEKDQELNEQLIEANASVKVKAPTEEAETVGNNLSFPVIWAEDVAKTLRTPPTGWVEGEEILTGDWWYVWGPEPIDPKSIIYSCAPSPSDEFLCADNKTVPGSDVYKGWVQKDASNYWEAYNANANGVDVNVDFIDWGDNLESIDWRINSKVRTELVLYKVLDVPVLQYPMRHVDGWGITEVHGLQTDLDGVIYDPTIEDPTSTFGKQATVYSTHTRMTIQKLNVAREDLKEGDLEWNSETSQWTGEGIINEPIFSKALSEAGDGPEFFNAEVNVKGKIMYGYTWDMKAMNDGTGDYRITYSFDQVDATNSTDLNTFFTETTQIIVAEEEEEEVTIAAEGESGGIGVLLADKNLTYMDIRIVGKTTGGAGGNSGGNGGGNSGGAGNSGGGGGNNGGGGPK